MRNTATLASVQNKNQSFFDKMKKDLDKNKYIYIMLTPLILYYVIFAYFPMLGLVIAFKDYSPNNGIFGSQWVGFQYFNDFFTSPYFLILIRNTLVISLSSLAFAFPAAIMLALMMNEVRNILFKKTIQTFTYLPYFISLAVVCGMIREFTMDSGLINDCLAAFGFERQSMLNNPNLFVPIYVISDIWQSVGWGSIIYMAALSGIDQQLYEAATLDGANKMQQFYHVTLPGIIPTIMIMLILRMGNILNVGFEKIILLYNPLVYDTADVLSTFVYRKGLQEFNWGYSTAAGMFNSIVNMLFLLITNKISVKVNEVGLW